MDAYPALSQAGHTAWQQVDSKVRAFPSDRFPNVDSLVSHVKQSFLTDSERVRAFYTWIALNISYDIELLDHYRLSSGLGMQLLPSVRTQHADTVFRHRKAVCEGICRLMNTCCEKSGIRSWMVAGITRLEEAVDEKILHTWNAVLIDSSWRLVDVTWSGGHISPRGEYIRRFSDKYFFPAPRDFIADHWPLDPMWQLLALPVSKKEFMDGVRTPPPPFFNYRDSINAYFRLDKADREYADLQHYHAADPGNENYTLASDYYIYNKAVTVFNLAALYFEDYFRYASKLEGKPVTRKNNKECIRLLAEPKKLLEEGLAFSANRSFHHNDIGAKFSDMVKTSEQRLKDVNSLLDNYYKLQRSYR